MRYRKLKHVKLKNQVCVQHIEAVFSLLQEEMDSNPMVSSLLNKLANYTNLTQGAQEHEEADDDEGPKKKAVKVQQRAWFLYSVCITASRWSTLMSCTVAY